MNIKNLNVMVVGGGAREHALVWGLAKSPFVTDLWCVPGNYGIGREVLQNGHRVVCVPNIASTFIGDLCDFAKAMRIDLTVFGPETPLVLGAVDLFESAGLVVFGPNKSASRLEGSKCFAQEFAERNGLPYAFGKCFSDPRPAKDFAESLGGRSVVKADGLCSGKGAFVRKSFQEASATIDYILDGNLGVAGERIVIQELLEGEELSLHILCDGNHWKLLPEACDYKRLSDNDKGPNTGGMGAYSPYPNLPHEEIQQIAEVVMRPFLAGCQADGIVFKGLLYVGLMLTKDGPKILEFNVRFGDPETEVIVPRLKTDLAELLYTTAVGRLSEVELQVHHGGAVCVVMASRGYPAEPEFGKAISGLKNCENRPNTKVFHYGTRKSACDILTPPGRVLAVTGWSDKVLGLFPGRLAYDAVADIRFDGAHFRTDILPNGFGKGY